MQLFLLQVNMSEPQSTPEQMAAGKSHGGIGGNYKVSSLIYYQVVS